MGADNYDIVPIRVNDISTFILGMLLKVKLVMHYIAFDSHLLIFWLISWTHLSPNPFFI